MKTWTVVRKSTARARPKRISEPHYLFSPPTANPPRSELIIAAAQTTGPGYSVLIALLLFIAASVWLGTLAQKAMEKKEFLKGFFLGNRGLGAWTLALTATVQ